MLILTESKLRQIMRDELERFMGSQESLPDSYSIRSANGGELIMPSPIKEKFDEGEVKSIGDIL